MEAFKFKLEGLLKLRKFKEDNQKVILGKIIKEINILNDEITTLKADIGVGYKSQEDILKENTDGKLLQFFPYFIQGKWEHIKDRENKILKLRSELSRRMKEMEKIMADVKVIESLKEKKEKDYKKEKNKKEFEKLDDILIRKGNKILKE
ncbi:MAG: flagellar export protein FliJ [Bacteriovoracaceae bacterium]